MANDNINTTTTRESNDSKNDAATTSEPAVIGPQPPPKYTDDDLSGTPLFFTSLEDAKDNPTVEALSSLLYDDNTPDEIAENFKFQGNKAFMSGKRGYKDALQFYDQGLEQEKGITDKNLKIALYANRAQVHLALGNYGHTIADCEKVLELTENKHMKALFRAAKAASMLKKWEQCIKYCNLANKIESGNKDIAPILAKAQAEWEKEKQREEKARAEKEAKESAVLGMIHKVTKRGIRIGADEFKSDHWSTYSQRSQTPVFEDPETGELHFEVLFVYDDHDQSDFIQDFSESQTFADHFMQMFPPLGPPVPWEEAKEPSKRKYYVDNLSLFFCVVNPKKFENKYFEIKDFNTTLGQVLRRKDYAMPGNSCRPIFHILPKDSPTAKEWRSS